MRNSAKSEVKTIDENKLGDETIAAANAKCAAVGWRADAPYHFYSTIWRKWMDTTCGVERPSTSD
jgi:hypothetical protein